MRILIPSVLLIGLSSLCAASPAPVKPHSLLDLTTCAVYFRMVAGSMRQARNLSALSAIEEDKMQQLIGRAREQARSDVGAADAERHFQERWREVLDVLTTEMNANYENVGRLKYLYDERCEALVDSPSRNGSASFQAGNASR